jgi:abortive infection bacteriophage resistance protein
MKYSKPALSISKQVDLLESRGLKVIDKDKAEYYLSNISYYRFSAYLLPFQHRNPNQHKFNGSVTFEKILDLYLFDRELRLLVFDIIERLEIAFRTQIIYQYSHEYGAWWYEDPTHFTNNYQYSRNLAKVDEEIERSSEVFIDHYKSKYTTPQRPPAWMTFEVISMGLLSKVFRNLKNSSAKKEIAKHFMLPNPYILESWMHSITYVRNLCAHHSRLWNRTLTLKPQLLRNSKNVWLSNNNINPNKLFAFLSCSLYLLKVVNPKTRTGKHFRELLNKYPKVNVRAMGFPSNWEKEELWK